MSCCFAFLLGYCCVALPFLVSLEVIDCSRTPILSHKNCLTVLANGTDYVVSCMMPNYINHSFVHVSMPVQMKRNTQIRLNLISCFNQYCTVSIHIPTLLASIASSRGLLIYVFFPGRIIIAFLCQSSLHCRLRTAGLFSCRTFSCLWFTWTLEALAGADAWTMTSIGVVDIFKHHFILTACWGHLRTLTDLIKRGGLVPNLNKFISIFRFAKKLTEFISVPFKSSFFQEHASHQLRKLPVHVGTTLKAILLIYYTFVNIQIKETHK